MPETYTTTLYKRTQLVATSSGEEAYAWVAVDNPLEELLNGYANLHKLVAKVEELQPMVADAIARLEAQ